MCVSVVRVKTKLFTSICYFTMPPRHFHLDSLTQNINIPRIFKIFIRNNANFANNVNQFKNRLDKQWKMHDIIFNYRADFADTKGLA